jgi:hypothetical protein
MGYDIKGYHTGSLANLTTIGIKLRVVTSVPSVRARSLIAYNAVIRNR